MIDYIIKLFHEFLNFIRCKCSSSCFFGESEIESNIENTKDQ